MVISSGFNTALAGARRGMESLQENASQIANSSVADGEGQNTLAEAVVGLKLSELQIKASMQTLRTMDEVLGTLLDVEA